jgi:hypothetical protein
MPYCKEAAMLNRISKARSLFVGAAGTFGAAVATLALPVLAQDIQRVPPAPGSIAAPDFGPLGRAHSLVVRGDKLYVGATSGIAVIDAQGKLVRSTPLLPETHVRLIDVNGEDIAWSGYTINDMQAGAGWTGALMWGEPSRRLEVQSAELGLLDAEGKPVWSAKLAEPMAVSAPAIGNSVVAVQDSKSMRLFDRAKGTQVQEVSMFTNYLGISAASNSRLAVMQPVWQGEEVFGAHQSWFKKVAANGNELVSTKSLGKNFTFLTAGPVACKGNLILGEAAYPQGNVFTGKKARVYAANAKAESVWYKETGDEVSGVSDIACSDELIFAAANAHITALTHDGKVAWQFDSKGGALIPGTHRGQLRAGTLPIAHQIFAGRQMVHAGRYLYITSRAERNWKGKLDVITVFEARTGTPVEQIEVNTMVIDMAVFGPDLALATSEGLRFVALKP